MVDTMDAFIEKLQAEGVEAGRQAAEAIRAEAQRQADELIRGAQSRARAIVAAAETESQRIRARTDEELKLAIRDAVIHLREDLNRAIRRVLAAAVEARLRDPEFLRNLLHELIMQYVQSDAAGARTITVRVSEDMGRTLTRWAVGELRRELAGTGTTVDLRGTLDQAGFEYHVSDGIVEVTVESVVEVLSELVAPTLREAVAQGIAGEGHEESTARADHA